MYSITEIRDTVALEHGWVSWAAAQKHSDKKALAKLSKIVAERCMQLKNQREVERLAMTIVHHLGEFYKLPVTFRQRTNDDAIDYVQAKILEYANTKNNN